MGAPEPILGRSRRLPAAVVIAALMAATGCAQSNPFADRRTMLGTLKTNVAHLESERQELKRQLAEAQQQNRRLENRLVQEEAHSESLAARLEDVRKLGRGTGFDPLDFPDPSASDPSPSPPPRTTPANRPRRKAPFAQIPGQIHPLPDRTESDEFGDPSPDESSLFPSTDEFGPQSRRDDDRYRWLPVARGWGAEGRVR